MVAVPLAYDFNFIVFRLWINKEALMVYSAIPLSAVGEYYFMDERIAF
jgi:hypothetical protein